PYRAPTDAYVAIPPASLPALAAISPGPRKAKSRRSRAARRLRGRRRGRRPRTRRSRTPAGRPRTRKAIGLVQAGDRHAASLRGFAGDRADSAFAEQAEVAPPPRREHELEDVVHGHDPDQPLLLVDHGHGGEVV